MSQIQVPPLVRRFRRLLARVLQGTVALSRVYPEWHPGDKLESDIFEGISDTPLENQQQVAGMGQ